MKQTWGMTQMSQFAKSNGKPGNNYDVRVAMQQWKEEV